jgi:putative spermidine/putrescine transport system ATP-binding protein
VRHAALPITIRELTKRYGKAHALDHVDVDIRSGEFLTLLGPSGSGKTTLLTVLAGFTRPDSGSVRFGDVEMICTPPHKRDVGMVFQNYALFPHMSVAGNVAFPLKLRGVSREETARRVDQALETVRLGGFGARGIDQLSGGQRQRVALARAIVFEPRILLMDEPLSALDKQLREHMQIELRQLHDKLGMTTVYVTHDQREALTMSDRIAVISSGRIVQLDTPRALYERPVNRFVAEFIGESAFVPVTVTDGAIICGEHRLRADSAPNCAGARLVMLRPEHLHIVDPVAAEISGLNLLQARLVAIVYQGDSTLVHVVLPDGTAIGVRGASMATSVAHTAQAGDSVMLGFEPANTRLLPPEPGSA